jgi:uracil-DNA glycosylase family 4
MGFFAVAQKQKKEPLGLSVDLLHKHECSVCSLRDEWPNLCHPHASATGSKKPVVYIIGEGPGRNEDEQGKQFVGKAGDILRMRIPSDWFDYIRWNNVVRCRPPKNREPTPREIECCRPSIERDIEAAKPAAIFGFGNVPLRWAIGETGISMWTGRRVPVQIGSHRCWYFPITHPSAIAHSRKFEPRSPREYGSDLEFAFALHVKRAFEDVDAGLPPVVIHTPEQAAEGVEWVTGHGGWDNVDRIKAFLNDCDQYEQEIGLDYETNAKRPYGNDAKILTVAISGERGTLAWPFDHPGAGWSDEQRDELWNYFKQWLLHARCRKVSHGLNFELEWSGVMFGIATIHAGAWEDSLTQSYVLDERRGTHDLDFVCLQRYGMHLKAISNLDRANLIKCPVDQVLRYNGIDAKYHRIAYIDQLADIEASGQLALYEEALARVPTVVLTQIKGMPVNIKTVQKYHDRYSGELDDIEADIRALKAVKDWEKRHGKPFNIASNPNVLSLLQETGHRDLASTNEKVLEELKGKSTFVDLLLAHRGVAKLLSTYVEPLMPGSPVLFPGNMLHPRLNTASLVTWRTSSSEINSQNVPKRGEGSEVREQIEDPEKWVVAFDYAGIQARNVAMESLDKELVDAFWNDYDIHTDWMEEIIRRFPRWIKEGLGAIKGSSEAAQKLRKKYRGDAKNGFVFPSFFGAQPKSKAAGLGVPIEIMTKIHDKFFERFHMVEAWQNSTIANYYKTGYVTGLSGFRRHAPVAQTEIINTPIQSDESVVVLSAMTRLSRKQEWRFQPSIEIHDDLTFFWTKREIDDNAEVVAREMTRLAYPWMHVVPIEIEMSVGRNWATVHEVAKFTSKQLWDHKRGK